MKLSKKIVSLLTVTALAASLTACGSSNGKSGSDSSGKKTYKIGICQLVEHNALDAATKGFKKALTDKLGKDNVEFDEQNAQGESTNCSTICNGFVTNGVDLIMANATGALQAAVSATNELPIVGTSVTDYGTALNIKDWKGTSGTNVTGTADLAPIDKQEDMILEIKPDVKKVGILFCSSEPNSAYQAKLMEDELKKDKIEYKEYTASDSNERQPVPKLMLSTFQQTTLWLLVLKLLKMLLFLPVFLYLQEKKEFVKPESLLFPSVTTTLVTRQVRWLIKFLKRVLIPEKWLSRQTKIRQNFTTKKTATL